MLGSVRQFARKRGWALFLVALGIWPMFTDPSLPNGLAMGAFLLWAWRDTFYPSPSIRTPLRDLLQGYRDGTYTSDRTSRAVGMAGMVCLLASFIVRAVRFFSS